MPKPVWLPYGLALLMAVVSVYCAGRVVLAKPLGRHNHYDISVGHVFMALAMLGMLVPGWNVVPVGLWEVVFAGLAAYFLVMSARRSLVRGGDDTAMTPVHGIWHYLIHMVMALAMLYMYWLGMPVAHWSSGNVSMSGPPMGTGDPALTALFLVPLLASAVWQLDASARFSQLDRPVLSALGAGSGTTTVTSDERPWLAPRLEKACHIAMCLTMAYMLVLIV